MLKGMSETQKRLFRGGGGFAALEDGKTLEQIISGGKLALKPQLEKENQSMMNMMMAMKNKCHLLKSRLPLLWPKKTKSNSTNNNYQEQVNYYMTFRVPSVNKED